MPPRKFSRHTFVTGVLDQENYDPGVLYLTEREPFRFQERPDNIRRVVREGDTLWHLAAEFYAGLTERPAGLWWIIADFQDPPIIDPTVELTLGTTVFAPSPRVVLEEIFSESRRRESNVT